MPIISHKIIQERENDKIIQSIFTRGLCALKNIPDHITTNPVLEIQSLQGNICVNYLNLEELSDAEKDTVINQAVFEEYCGVYGITLERQWPFQRATSLDMLEAEASERLNSSIVFMLTPPKKFKAVYNFPHLTGPTPLAFYEIDGEGNLDGVTQAFNRNLIDLSKVHCQRISEFKTVHHFRTEEFLSIFVPEALYDKVKSVFSDLPVTIIKVPQCTKTFQDIPEILNKLHQQQLKQPMTLSVPDYATALSDYTKTHHIDEFSLHAVRLHTSFDFITRKITASSQHQPILKRAQAIIQHRYPDDSAWITVHKNIGLSKKSLFKCLEQDPLLSRQHIEMMKSAALKHTALFDALSEAKHSEDSLTIVYQNLSKYQLMQLEKIGVQVAMQPFFNSLNFPKILKPKVEAIIQNQENHAVTTIQARVRGFFSRRKLLSQRQDVIEPIESATQTNP